MPDINKSFQLKVLADITDYQTKMAAIPGVTQKQAAAAALRMEREMVKAAAAGNRAIAGVGQAGAEAGNKLAGAFELGHKSARRLGGALSLISPELGALTREAGHFAGGLSLAGDASAAILGPLALIAAAAIAVGAGLSHWTEGLNEAEKASAEVAQEVLKEELGLVKGHDYATEAVEAIERASVARRLDTFDRFFHTVNRWVTESKVLQLIAGDAITEAAEKEQEEFAFTTELLDTQAKGLRELAFEAKAAADAQKEFADSEKETAKWLGEQADLEADRARAAKKAGDERKKAALELAEARQSELDDKADAQFATREKQIKEAEAKQKDLADLRVKSAADVTAAQKQISEDDQRAADATRDAWLGAFGAINSAVGQLFKNSKAAAISSAIVNIALGATKTIAELGFPLAIPALIAEGAEGAAQIATIAGQDFTPQFHSGGVIPYGVSPRGGGDVPVTAQTGESFLNRQTTARLGKKGVDELNRGGSLGGALYVSTMVGHRTMDRWAVKSFSRVNSPTARAVNKAQTGVRPGRRQRL